MSCRHAGGGDSSQIAVGQPALDGEEQRDQRHLQAVLVNLRTLFARHRQLEGQRRRERHGVEGVEQLIEARQGGTQELEARLAVENLAGAITQARLRDAAGDGETLVDRRHQLVLLQLFAQRGIDASAPLDELHAIAGQAPPGWRRPDACRPAR